MMNHSAIEEQSSITVKKDDLKGYVADLLEKIVVGFVILEGPLGVGKSTFVREFLKNFGVVSVPSPTFTYVERYRIGEKTIFHADLYRVEYATQLRDLELEFYQEELFFVEWGERFENVLQPIRAKITVEFVPDCPDTRQYNLILYKFEG